MHFNSMIPEIQDIGFWRPKFQNSSQSFTGTMSQLLSGKVLADLHVEELSYPKYTSWRPRNVIFGAESIVP